VHKVLPQAFAKTTDPTVIAVIDTLVAVVIPELADRAVVICCPFQTVRANFCSGLWRSTELAEHVPCHLAAKGMWEGKIAGLIVTVSAGEPVVAVETLYLDVSKVVHAAQSRLLTVLWLISRLTIISLHDLQRTECGFQIAGSEVVGVGYVEWESCDAHV